MSTICTRPTGTALLTTGIARRRHPRPALDRVPGGRAKDLRWLADARFPELAEL